MKSCTKCKEIEELTDFRKRNSKSGYHSQCKICERTTKQTKKVLTEEEINRRKKQQKEYRERNKEKEKERKKKWALLNTEKVRNKAKTYYEDNKQRILSQVKAYKISEKGKLTEKLVKARRYGAKKATSDNTVTYQSLLILKNLQQNCCYYCKVAFSTLQKKDIHLDHVVPLSKGGIHSITNVVWSCAKCNHKKSSSMPEMA